VLLPTAIAAAAELNVSEATGRLGFHAQATLADFDGVADTFHGHLSTDTGTGELIVDAHGLSTGLGPRDSRMLTWCLEVDRFPEIRFTVQALRGDTAGLQQGTGNGSVVLAGLLAVRDVTRPVEVPATWAWEGPNLHLKGKLDMRWTDWNVPDPSVLLSTLEPDMSVVFDVVAKPS
jgi:polyisoprenoid-binding protein YceI